MTTKERPILFRGPMVKAILEGRKTQTRRVIKHQPQAPRAIYGVNGADTILTAWPKAESEGISVKWNWEMSRLGSAEKGVTHHEHDSEWGDRCPYGQPGDRLWVRETFLGTYDLEAPHDYQTGEGYKCVYAADGGTYPEYYDEDKEEMRQGYKPSIHMPRWASRIDLEITKVRVERLQDISEEDARAEGCHGETQQGTADFPTEGVKSASEDYADLWESINEEKSWDLNPWVWVIEFKRVRP